MSLPLDKISEQETLSRSKFHHFLKSMHHTIRDPTDCALKMDAELVIMEERWKSYITKDQRFTGWYLQDDTDRTYKGIAFQPDVKCFELVAHAYTEAGMGIEGAKRVEHLVNRCCSNKQSNNGSTGSQKLFSAAVKAWALADHWTEAKDWLDRMAQTPDNAPDMMTYTMYLQTLSQSQSANMELIKCETNEILDRMRKLTSTDKNWVAPRRRDKLSQRFSRSAAYSIDMARGKNGRLLAFASGAFVATTILSIWKTKALEFRTQTYNQLLTKGMTKFPPTAALSIAALAVALGGILFVGRGTSNPEPKQDEQSNGVIDESATMSPETTTTKQLKVKRTDEESIQADGLLVKPIGVVHSIYRLCVGTPRQGLLAPNAHGRIELQGLSADTVDGLESFSHIWIVFIFHLNTQAKNSNRIPSKIAPPALGGRKIGVFATRSPHRNNPIGMTLCKLDSITKPTKNCNKTFLNVSGLDLVDGTPVVDIKPYVPHYDSVPSDQLTLPSWVSGGLATRRPVQIEPDALLELRAILTSNPEALQFYGSNSQSVDVTLDQVAKCIDEVLAIDVRSAWQTKKARAGKFQAERSERVQGEATDDGVVDDDKMLCTQQLDNLLIHYTVSKPDAQNRDASEGSGAEDAVSVHSIQLYDQTGTKSNGLQIDRIATTDDLLEIVPLIETPPANAVEVAKPNENESLPIICDDDDAPATLGCQPSEVVETESSESLPNSEVESKQLPPLVLSPQLLKKTPDKGRVKSDTSPDDDIPTDGEYNALKNYWSKAASKNTPTGLIPEKEVRTLSATKKFFVFSDKSKPLQATDEAPVVETTEDLIPTQANSNPET